MDDPHCIGLGETRAQPVRERVIRRIAGRLHRLAAHEAGYSPVVREKEAEPVPESAGRRRLAASRLTRSWLKMANSPSASTVTTPPCTMRPLLKMRRSVTSCHPAFEHGFLSGEGGTHVPQSQRDGRPDRSHDRIGRGEDDVEGGRQHRPVHAAGCSFVGDIEDPPTERPRRLEVEDERQRHGIERTDHHVIGHGATQWHVLGWTVLVGRDEPG